MKISVKSNFLQLQARRADVNERSFFIIIICFNHLDLTDLPNCAALCNWAYFPSSIMEKHSDICRPLFISFTSSCGLCVSFSLFISIHEARKLLGVPPPLLPRRLRLVVFWFRDAAVRERMRLLFNQGVPRVIGIVTERALLREHHGFSPCVKKQKVTTG